METRLVREIRRFLFDRRALNLVVSSVILTAGVVAMGSVVLYWTYYRSSVLNTEYADAIDSNLARIKEKIVFEYITHNASENELTVYIFNCGKSNNIDITSVYLGTNSWHQSFYDIELRFLNGTLNESLDIHEEGYFKLSANLDADTSYSIRIITGRGRLFDATFIA